MALKLIAPEAAADEVFARRFAEESRIAASIEHPNVVPIYAAGEEGGVPFIAMRYVAGADLGRRLAREGRLEPAVAVGADRPGRQRARRDPRRRPGPPRRQAGQRPAQRGRGRRARLHHRLRRRPQRRHRVRPDPDRPLRRHPRLRRARADLRRRGRRPGRRLRPRLPALQAAHGRGAVPQDGEAARLYAHLNDPPPAPSLYVPEVSMALDDVVDPGDVEEPRRPLSLCRRLAAPRSGGARRARPRPGANRGDRGGGDANGRGDLGPAGGDRRARPPSRTGGPICASRGQAAAGAVLVGAALAAVALAAAAIVAARRGRRRRAKRRRARRHRQATPGTKQSPSPTPDRASDRTRPTRSAPEPALRALLAERGSKTPTCPTRKPSSGSRTRASAACGS